MNSVLSTIAAIIVVLLLAALVGPTFVDWNAFRSEIEAQGRKLTGRELKIGGDISFVVLPAPHLTLNDVSLSNLEGGEEADFARVGKLDGEVALAPLLSGKISVTSVTVTRPQFHFEVMPDGRANWHGLFSGPVQEDGVFGLSSVSLEKARFEDGTITYVDHRSGRSWRLDHVGGDVTATSLVGPMRASLNFDFDDVPLSLRLALGNFSEHRAFPITAELQTQAALAKFLFSGVSTGFSSSSRIDGTGSLELGTTKTADGQKPRPPLRIESGIVASEGAATFRDLAVAMAGTTLKGDAKADWSDRPEASIHLNGEALTLDPAFDWLRDLAAGGNVPLGSLASLPMPGWIDIDADVKVAGVLVRDVLVKDATLDLSLKKGTLGIERATGDVGGGTAFELSGALARDDKAGRFDGKVSVTSRNLAALAAWLSSLHVEPGEKPDGVAPAPVVPQVLAKEPGRAFSAASDVTLTPDRLAFDNLRAAYAPKPDRADIAGNIAFTEQTGTGQANTEQASRPLVTAALAAKSFDLDPLIALWPGDAPKPLALLAGNDADLSLTADHLTLAGETVSGLDASMAMTGGTLALRRLEAADLAGAKLSLSGSLHGVTEAKLSSLAGNLHGTVDTQKSGGLFRLAGIDAPGIDGPMQLTLDTNSGEAVDSQARLDTIALKGTIAASRVDAVLKRGHASDGKVDRIDLIANAANNDGAALIRQLGMTPDPALTGTGSASLQLSGAIDKPLGAALRVNVGEATFNAKGELSDRLGDRAFSGHVDVSASAVTPVLAALGVSPGVSGFAAAQAAGPSFVFSADVKAGRDVLAFNGLESVAGNFHVSGEAAYAYGQDGKKPVLTGKLQANAIDLTTLFATEKGPNDTVWPTAALDWSALGAFDGEVDLEAGALKLGLLHLDQTEMHLSLSDSVLTASPFSGKLADGNAAIGARIEGGARGEPGIGLTVAVDGADMRDLGPELFGASFGTGRMDIKVDLEGQGRSWLALMSTVTGKGSFTTRSAGLTSLDLPGFSAGLKQLKSLDGFPALEKATLENGNTPMSGLAGDFAMKDGVVHFSKDGLELEGGKAKLDAMFDLGRLAADSELDVTLDDPQGAPPFNIVAAGKVGAIGRRIDTVSLQNFVSTRMIKKSAEDAGLNFIPKELKNLIGIGSDEKGAPVPLPMERPQPKAAGQ